jgi:site-specific recombinase
MDDAAQAEALIRYCRDTAQCVSQRATRAGGWIEVCHDINRPPRTEDSLHQRPEVSSHILAHFRIPCLAV